jgi:conjugative transfer signal peptidase TraF
MTSRRFVFLMASAGGLWTAAVLAAYAAGLRINETPSLPVGLWQMQQPGAVERGRIVSFCPLDEAPFRLARERGYLSNGRCPGGFEPMLKPVAAIEGDAVEVMAEGVSVNGRLLPNTAPRETDSAGRAMPPARFGSFTVAPGEVWLASSFSALSFDSRYFGPVSIARIEGLAKPLWVWGNAP